MKDFFVDKVLKRFVLISSIIVIIAMIAAIFLFVEKAMSLSKFIRSMLIFLVMLSVPWLTLFWVKKQIREMK